MGTNIGFTLDPDGVWKGGNGNDIWDQPDLGTPRRWWQFWRWNDT